MRGLVTPCWLVLAACGRLEFDPAPDAVQRDVIAPADATLDAPTICSPLPCTNAASIAMCDGVCVSQCLDKVLQSEAAVRCVQWGGTLASIGTPQTSTCVAALTTDDVWIGSVQSAGALTTGDGWTWIDGTPTGYTDWNMFEPNDVDNTESGDEQCLQMYDIGPWNDYACTGNFAFVCAR